MILDLDSEVGSERKTTGSGCLRLDHDFLPDHRKTSQSTRLQTIKLSGDLMRSIFFSRFQVAQTRARCNGFLVILGRDGGAPGVRNLSRERISVRGAFY